MWLKIRKDYGRMMAGPLSGPVLVRVKVDQKTAAKRLKSWKKAVWSTGPL